MKRTNAIARALAVVMAVIMIASLTACVSSYNSNPIVAKVGNVKLDLNQYLTLYNNTDTNSNMYYAYMQYGLIDREQYANYMLDELVNYGVQLDQLEKQNITLTEEGEAKLQQDIEDKIREYCNTTYASKIDSSITDEEAKYQAELELLKADLANSKMTFDEYRKNLEDSLRQTARLERLHDLAVEGVSASNDDVVKYFEENAKTDTTVAAFKSGFDSFVVRTSETLPFFMPHPEKAVEDDPETADKNEAKEADPYGEFFSVYHTLLQFKTSAGDDVKDLAQYAADDADFVSKMEEFETLIPTLDRAGFLEKCFDKDTDEDPGMLQPAYQYFGYIMQQELIDSYYPGFGYAAMKLMFGDEWEPAEANDEAKEQVNPDSTEYALKYFTLTDGTQVVKVFTKAGAHYIILNENEIFSMYDEDGYLMVPVYENDELVTDSEGIVTLHGHMTQAQLDAMNETLSKAHKQITIEKDDKTAEDNKTDATEDPNANEGEDAENAENTEEEEDEPITAKTLFEACRKAKQTDMENDMFNEKFKEWKESTKIVTHKNLLKTFYQG